MIANKHLRRLFAGGILTFTLGSTFPSAAQTPNEAQTLFDDALALMKLGKYADACPKLVKSQQLDPGTGTQFRLAQCYEGMGKIASAWKLYVEVANESKKAGRADREEQARERVDELRPRLPTLTIFVPAAVASSPGFQLTRDAERLEKLDWGQKIPVDPGDHVVSAVADKMKRFQQTVSLVEKANIEVQIPTLEPEIPANIPTASPSVSATAAPTATSSASPSSSGTSGPVEPGTQGGGMGGQKIAAITIGAVGVAGILVGLGAGAAAISQWNDALSFCPNGDRTKCSDQGIRLGADASVSAGVSTVGFIAGGVMLAGATVLWILAPSSAPKTGLQIVPVAGQRGGGMVVMGSF
ncbi:MAG: hypothetical protein IPK82_25590 [Polyangiaceae bacterium]|nr:hypothetical protein [Polyangiaceae bacterium]